MKNIAISFMLVAAIAMGSASWPRPAEAGFGKLLVAGLVAKAIKKAGTKVGQVALRELIVMAQKSKKVRDTIISIADGYIGHSDVIDAAAGMVISSVEMGEVDMVAYQHFKDVVIEDAREAGTELAASEAGQRILTSPKARKAMELAGKAKDWWDRYQYCKERDWCASSI